MELIQKRQTLYEKPEKVLQMNAYSVTIVIVLSMVIVTKFSQTSCLGLSFETINNELWHLKGVKTILTPGRV